VNELDQFWSQELAAAIENAKRSGRADVADYLELRARNDSLRHAGVRWLIESMITISSPYVNGSANVEIFREEPHRFEIFNANMVGMRLKFQQGVRCLTTEAGWTRTPADGFMRGGTLAAARLSHFGKPKAGVELGLLLKEAEPHWNVFRDGKPVREFLFEDIGEHFRLFTD
jgi:hypothetical protein